MANSGAFRKGDGRPRKPKGVPNKLTRELKDMILQALSEAGGVQYLKRQAIKSPNAFLALVGRVLPLQIDAGPGWQPLFTLPPGVTVDVSPRKDE